VIVMGEGAVTGAYRSVPCLVVLYVVRTGRLGAEFSWGPRSGVSLRVFDDKWGDLARQDYDEGVSSYAEDRMIPREEGEAFMRALLEPSQSSIARYVRLATCRVWVSGADGAGPGSGREEVIVSIDPRAN
jgi:hypothetical protein